MPYLALHIETNNIVYDSLPEIVNAIRQNRGVLTIKMLELRKATKKERLGRSILESIDKELQELNVAHFPTLLPANQNEFVRLYLRDGRVGGIINACNNLGEESDDVLRNAGTSPEAEILRRVRELVINL